MPGTVSWKPGCRSTRAEQYRLLLQGHLDERARLETRRSGVTGSDGGVAAAGGERPPARVDHRVRAGHGDPQGLSGGPGRCCDPRRTAGRRCLSERLGRTARAEADRRRNRCRRAPARRRAGTAPERREAPASAPPARNLYPADAVLNLPVGRHSAGLARLAAVEAARGSFADARAAIERASGVRLGQAAGRGPGPQRPRWTLEAFYAARRPQPRPGRVLGLQADGKGIVMRPGSLRPGTAARAARASAKLATRLSPGEKHGRKRMAEVVAVYDLDPARARPPTSSPPAPPTRDSHSRTSRRAGRARS